MYEYIILRLFKVIHVIYRNKSIIILADGINNKVKLNLYYFNDLSNYCTCKVTRGGRWIIGGGVLADFDTNQVNLHVPKLCNIQWIKKNM